MAKNDQIESILIQDNLEPHLANFIARTNYFIGLYNLLLLNKVDLTCSIPEEDKLITMAKNTAKSENITSMENLLPYINKQIEDIEKILLVPSGKNDNTELIVDLINEYKEFLHIDIIHFIKRSKADLKNFIRLYNEQMMLALFNIAFINVNGDDYLYNYEIINNDIVVTVASEHNDSLVKQIVILPENIKKEIIKYYHLIKNVTYDNISQIEAYFLASKVKEIYVLVKVYEAEVTNPKSCSHKQK